MDLPYFAWSCQLESDQRSAISVPFEVGAPNGDRDVDPEPSGEKSAASGQGTNRDDRGAQTGMIGEPGPRAASHSSTFREVLDAVAGEFTHGPATGGHS